MKAATLLVTAALVVAVAAEKVRFDNYKVYRITPENEEQLQVLRQLEKIGGYLFWSDIGSIYNPVDIMVPPHLAADFEDIINISRIPSKLIIENVQEKVEKSEPKKRGSIRSVGWTEYHTVEEVRQQIYNFFSKIKSIVLLVDL